GIDRAIHVVDVESGRFAGGGFEAAPDHHLPDCGEHECAVSEDVHGKSRIFAPAVVRPRTLQWTDCEVCEHVSMTIPRITSRQNPRVQEVVRLRTGRERRRQGRFVIDGFREISRAMESGIRPIEAFVCEGLEESRAESMAAESTTELLRALRQ